MPRFVDVIPECLREFEILRDWYSTMTNALRVVRELFEEKERLIPGLEALAVREIENKPAWIRGVRYVCL